METSLVPAKSCVSHLLPDNRHIFVISCQKCKSYGFCVNNEVRHKLSSSFKVLEEEEEKTLSKKNNFRELLQ